MKIKVTIISLLILLSFCVIITGCGVSKESFKENFNKVNDKMILVDNEEVQFTFKCANLTTSYNKKEFADELSSIIRKKEKLVKELYDITPPEEIRDTYEKYCKLLKKSVELSKDLEQAIRDDNKYIAEDAINESIKNVESTIIYYEKISNYLYTD